jgi:hypothetical protein
MYSTVHAVDSRMRHTDVGTHALLLMISVARVDVLSRSDVEVSLETANTIFVVSLW